MQALALGWMGQDFDREFLLFVRYLQGAGELALGTVALGTVALGTVALGTVALGTVVFGFRRGLF